MVALASAKWGDVDSLQTLLGFEEISYFVMFGYLAVAGFGLMALAGLGLGLILDNYSRERKWKRLGWWLLLLCLPLQLSSRSAPALPSTCSVPARRRHLQAMVPPGLLSTRS